MKKNSSPTLSSLIKEQPAVSQPTKSFKDPTSSSKVLDFSQGLKSLGTSVAQSVARSFLAAGTFVASYVGTKYDPKKHGTPANFLSEATKKTYTPIGDIEKKIFGTDKPVSFETVGKETLLIGGDDFAKKWGKYAVPLGVVMSGLDILPTGNGGAKQIAKASKLISKTDDVAKIAKTLKTIVKSSDDNISFLAKSLKNVTNEDDVLKVIRQATKIIDEPIAKEGLKTRGFIKSVSEEVPELRIAGQYIPRDTDNLAIKARNLILDNIDKAESTARLGTDDKAVAVSAELIKFYNEQAIKATTRAAKNIFYDKAADVASITARNLTENGRAIQAASILGRTTPEGMLRFASKEINNYNEAVLKGNKVLGGFVKRKTIPQLTARQTEEILTTAKKIMDMPDGDDKAMAFKRLTDKIADLIPSPLFKKIVTVWKAGLLTGLKTTGVNTFSNLFHGITETAKEIPATAVDSVASLFTGKRTTAITGFESKKGIMEGFKKGWRYLNTGFDERDIGAKLDYRRINFGNSKFAKGIQKYEETIFRLMGAEDQPFFYAAKARSLKSQAIAAAKNAKVKGGEATKFINNLITNPTDKMLKYAVGDAEMAVFQNPTTLGNAAKGIQKLLGGGGELVVPFGRTPAAVANQLINYSPVGIVKAIIQNIGKGRFDQRLFSQAVGRGITGTALMAIGQKLFEKNLINTDYPSGEKERELWKAEGRTPNSIKVGDKWRNVNVLGPAGFVLITGAKYQEALEKTGSIIEALSQAIVGGVKSLKEQTFLQGLSQIVDALDDPERFAQGYFSSTLSSVIPTIVGDFARAFDSKERKTNEILDRFKAKLPSLRQSLEPQIDILGRERERAGSVIETILDPSRPSKDVSTPVVSELRRLFDLGFNITPTMLGDKNGYKNLSAEENTDLWRVMGEIVNSKLSSLISLDKYKSIPDDLKAKNIEDFIDKANVIARTEMVMRITSGMEGDELKKKLAELKAGGLMNREVFNRYVEFSELGTINELSK